MTAKVVTPFRTLCFCAAAVLLASPAAAQQSSSDQPQEESKRLFWIIPNYRTSPGIADFTPIGPGEKFKLASKDAFDPGTFALAGLFAGEAQLTNQNKSFGQGAAGFGRYYGTAYSDLAIGDYMSEAVFPSLLHQDPRYFRKGTGSAWSRLGYAAGQIFLTHSDSGRVQFNYSEIAGNSVAVAISTSYYKDNRDAGDAVSKLGMQLGVDATSNVLKEFWPEIRRKFHRKRQVVE